MIDQRGSDDLPVVTLPKLRSLSVDELALDIATAVGTLRIPALTTFHLIGHTDFALDHIDFFIIPQNLTETLPPLRRSRSLSLVAGRTTTGKNGVTLRGSAGISDADMFDYSTSSAAEDDDDDSMWVEKPAPEVVKGLPVAPVSLEEGEGDAHETGQDAAGPQRGRKRAVDFM